MPLETLTTALRWRAELLLGKMTGRLGMVPWDLLWAEVAQRRELAWQPPPVNVLEHDGADGLALLEVAGDRYWVARETTPEVMTGMYKETFNPRHPHHFEFRECRIRPGDVVIDGGACEGFFVRFALRRGARVIAVEASSRMAEGLRRTYAREIADGRVIVRQALLADRPGRHRFLIDPAWPTGASVLLEEREGMVAEEVEAVSVDGLVAESPWGRCDFLKMDVEGSERGVVAGAAESLRRGRPCLAIAVYHLPSGYLDIRGDLRAMDLGYNLVGKGLVHGLDRIWRPLMLHAWSHPSRRPAPAF